MKATCSTSVITSCASPSSADGDATPISSLGGAGPVTTARLAARGIVTARDLLLVLPRGYDDLRRATPIEALAAVPDGTVVLVRGRVRRIHLFPRRFLDVFLETDAGDAVVRARWFRARAAMAKAYVKGSEVAVAGPLRTATDGTRELIHPTNVTAALAARGLGLGIRPRYGAIEGVRSRTLEQLRAAALARLHDGAPEVLPTATRVRLGLPPLVAALRQLHAPGEDAWRADSGAAGLIRARQRIVLERLLVAQLAFLLRRASAGRATVVVSASVAAAALARLTAALPFALTPSQARAVATVAADLGGARAMERLLVGDVGSGKTAVALAGAALVARAGGQTLMMVPTESLAEQQGRALAPLAVAAGLSLAVLTGSTPAGTRDELLAAGAAGRIDLLIGTQALLGDDVVLARLGLVVVDEQHRFGVAQRARLGRGGRGTTVPHLLAMSATPIPRSLALARHGDLDLSVLTERPAACPPASAVLCRSSDERRAAYARVAEAIGDGRQAFVVCPIRNEGRTGSVTAVAHHARLVKSLAPARVGLLHGALPAARKDATLRAFAAGALDVLVATTVVELGIDVANATVMIVEEAERFGLAQLHQLRGRVGRGRLAGICFLCPSDGAVSPEATARLEAVAATTDGFRLAELDLAQRGYGDLFGTLQSGEQDDVLADLAGEGAAGPTLVETARAEAERLLAGDPTLNDDDHAALAAAARARVATLFASEAG
jgi:ATP-dependent DNA helicase RecG